MEAEACAALTNSNLNNNLCLKKAHWQRNSLWYCHEHRSINKNILCSYNVAFNDLESLDQSDIEDEKLLKLNGYIYVQIGQPILARSHTVPMLLLSEDVHFTKYTLALEIKNAIQKLYEHPNIYSLSSYTLKDFKLHAISYDEYKEVYIAEICLK
jgi:hypothetical protein